MSEYEFPFALGKITDNDSPPMIEAVMDILGEALFEIFQGMQEDEEEFPFESIDWTGVDFEPLREACDSAVAMVEEAEKEINPAVSVFLAGKLWILNGYDLFMYDEDYYPYSEYDYMKRARDYAYVPTTTIGMDPNTGGGDSFESVNLLSELQMLSYIGNGVTKTYKVGFPIAGVEYISVDDDILPWNAFTVNTNGGTISFTEAPPKPAVTGKDNVRICIYRTGYDFDSCPIRACRTMGLFGLGGADSDRIFFAGNPERPNVDWHCEIAAPDFNVDPTYIPEDSFAYVGAETGAIMGYHRALAYQLIIKQANDQDAGIFLRSGATDAEGRAVFGLRQGSAAAGAVSRACFANLGDDPLFLSAEGIMGIQSLEVSSETSVQNRSYFINPRLLKEAGLARACAASWRGKYVLCINNRAYVLDGSQFRQMDPRSGSNAVYEAYFWDNIPATCLCEADGVLYFGTRDGKLCRFSDDLAPPERFLDNGAAIDALWTSKADDDGDFSRYKSTVKNGCHVLIKPGQKGSAKLYFLTQANAGELPGDLPGESELLCYESRGAAISLPAGRKVKKYTTLQIAFRNNEAGEGFALGAVIKNYIYGGTVKARRRSVVGGGVGDEWLIEEGV